MLLNYLGDSSIFGSNDSDRNDTESSEPFQNVTEMQESQGTYSGGGCTMNCSLCSMSDVQCNLTVYYFNHGTCNYNYILSNMKISKAFQEI